MEQANWPHVICHCYYFFVRRQKQLINIILFHVLIYTYFTIELLTPYSKGVPGENTTFPVPLKISNVSKVNLNERPWDKLPAHHTPIYGIRHSIHRRSVELQELYGDSVSLE